MDLVERVFKKVDRQNFVPESLRDQANIDAPLPIGYGQTISQPSTVLRMLKWLGAKPSEKILDIGSGSGWTSAILSKIVKPFGGKVFAVERIPQLITFGKNNCDRIGADNVEFHEAGEEYGLPQYAPFDRILVSAAAMSLPTVLLRQLKIGGKMVVPVQNDILEITKTSDSEHETIVHPGYIFVPLIKSSYMPAR